MADRSRPPFAPQDANEVSQVVASLERHNNKGKGKGGFSCRKKTYHIADSSDKTVDSWSMGDWDYKKPHLPTYARGLFTHTNNGKPEIAVRGYDKFFNVGEVVKTDWRNVEQHTRGPYELSVKENGCIIFISGLDDETLLITSKHSTGPRQDASANHAGAGEVWIEKQLSCLGRTKADLAKRLRSMNVTAVAELCDDEFEEHVLRYDPASAGLYLHGINLNLPEFMTYPGNLVANFAEEWGFKKTMYVMEDDIHNAKAFLDKVAETGHYAGRDTEGFVIRCQARDAPGAQWHDWFFKYKFDEPYLMYRQWREVTKSIITGRVPKFKKHQKITQEYILYARRQLAKDPQIGKRFNQNHGIIAMRDGFLQEKGMKGSDIILNESEDEATQASDVTKNIVLVPVATIGCGKTTVAVALTKLFGWGHQQNDNVQGKGKRSQIFANRCTNSMAAHSVIIADRNNHQRREREQIIADIKSVVPEAKFVALHYVHDRGNYDEIKEAMRERVLSRGDNHQTIQAGSKSQEEIIGIMDGFMKRFEPVDTERRPDDEFDLVIDLDVTASSRENLGTLVNQLHGGFPKLFHMPSDEEMDAAIESALTDYQPDTKHDLSKTFGQKGKDKSGHQNEPANGPVKTPKAPRVEFFCISVPADRIMGILNAVFSTEDAETARFFNQLKAMKRLQAAFHVTLFHRAQSSQYPEYWERLNQAWAMSNSEPLQNASNGTANALLAPRANTNADIAKSRVQLERVVWSDGIMAIVSPLIDADDNGFRTTNDIAHITIGTGSDRIKPKQSNDMLTKRQRGENRDQIKDLKIKGNIVLDGTVRAVMSK